MLGLGKNNKRLISSFPCNTITQYPQTMITIPFNWPKLNFVILYGVLVILYTPCTFMPYDIPCHALRSLRHCIGVIWSGRSTSLMNGRSDADSTPTLSSLLRRDKTFSSGRPGNTANTACLISSNPDMSLQIRERMMKDHH